MVGVGRWVWVGGRGSVGVDGRPSRTEYFTHTSPTRPTTHPVEGDDRVGRGRVFGQLGGTVDGESGAA